LTSASYEASTNAIQVTAYRIMKVATLLAV